MKVAQGGPKQDKKDTYRDNEHKKRIEIEMCRALLGFHTPRQAGALTHHVQLKT